MYDPYKILDVSEKASDDKVKEAYKKLVKKYHPDNYSDGQLSDIADEKMREINAAFDEIMIMRRGSSNAFEENEGNYYRSTADNDLGKIRQLIINGEYTRADELLESYNTTSRGAEWYFLKGTVCHFRGWLNEAYTNFEKATQMDTSNAEYRAAFNNMNRSRQGNMNGSPFPQYRTSSSQAGCSTCDICQGLICADCCCECMGGDLISCC